MAVVALNHANGRPHLNGKSMYIHSVVQQCKRRIGMAEGVSFIKRCKQEKPTDLPSILQTVFWMNIAGLPILNGTKQICRKTLMIAHAMMIGPLK